MIVTLSMDKATTGSYAQVVSNTPQIQTLLLMVLLAVSQPERGTLDFFLYFIFLRGLGIPGAGYFVVERISLRPTGARTYRSRKYPCADVSVYGHSGACRYFLLRFMKTSKKKNGAFINSLITCKY